VAQLGKKTLFLHADNSGHFFFSVLALFSRHFFFFFLPSFFSGMLWKGMEHSRKTSSFIPLLDKIRTFEDFFFSSFLLASCCCC